MTQANDYRIDMLELSQTGGRERFWHPGKPTAARVEGGAVIFTVPFRAMKSGGPTYALDAGVPSRSFDVAVAAYGDQILRFSVAFEGRLLPDDNPMLEMDPQLRRVDLTVKAAPDGWTIKDASGVTRMKVKTASPPVTQWRSGLPLQDIETFDATFFPDGRTAVPLRAWEFFFDTKSDAFPLGFVERDGRPVRAAFALHADAGERFAGAGERFARMDLSGHTLELWNTDGFGVNNRRAYKNVPFFVSSRPYGVFMHTSHRVRLSLADVSTCAAQAVIEEPVVDLFVIGGGSLERVLYNYRRLTGFPRQLPLWSYGTWMSRLTYFSADEVRAVGRRMREEDLPCDVLHVDTGWFPRDWVCDWQFSPERFAQPERFMREMREAGFRVSLWQTPNIAHSNSLVEEARREGYIAPPLKTAGEPSPDESKPPYAGQIDFSNPKAVQWYQGMIARVLRTGASNIKTDFGEDIDMATDYAGMSAARLRNLYALLYQKAAWEITQATTGEGIIFARAGWAGCQRYPVHWGGDSACSWDGMAGVLRGGLHLGLSGFAFWSHDVPGFYGVPDSCNSRPADDLYVRWTQFGVFTSHMRYHGTTPREPYEYPNVTAIVRKWLKLRYALIPYILEQSHKAVAGGMPVLRALVLHHEDDPTCWLIDDQYYFGEDFLVAPITNGKGARRVYLPAGKWIDLWTGKTLNGRRWLKVRAPLERMPVYVRAGAVIPVYPHPVPSTASMDLAKAVTLTFDEQYKGLSGSLLGPLTGL